MFSPLLHPELVDYPGFWGFAALLLAGVGVVLYIVGRLRRKAVSRDKGRQA